MHGGDILADVLRRHGVEFLFTLCGGHISPILVGAKAVGIRVIDVRHEVTAVFAADAVSRLTGIPGVAAVTAGPGVTNTITAIKNAQLAQSPLILLGGATATILRGRGALQDIDQMALVKPHVKLAIAVKKVRDLAPALERAFRVAQEGTPGPVFVECPVDLLYDEKTVREMYGAKALGASKGPQDVALQLVLRAHLARTFRGAARKSAPRVAPPRPPRPDDKDIAAAVALVKSAKRPVILLGSQVTLGGADRAARIADAVQRLGIPAYTSGMARGLLGAKNSILFRHHRSKALKEADLVILAGVPCDFRLNYGLSISRKASVIAVNRDAHDMKANRRPTVGMVADPAELILELAARASATEGARAAWMETLRARDEEREKEIAGQATTEGDLVNPVHLLKALDGVLKDGSILVGDGGDFVATASYVCAARGPLTWLDPGPFGTLGVGAGFALAAKLCRPSSDVWLLWGDGSAGYGLSEMDTFVRHGVNVLALVGNDASWAQIARDQVPLLGDEIGTALRRSDYHVVAQGFGAKGYALYRGADAARSLETALAASHEGAPVLVNAHLARTDFRKGSISM
ncbi:MAG TPA: thiamine pyrophosphate-binding protein [Polyangiaceae bacterium]|jgi:acetolactate synthase-1/2/3 large subunit